MTILLRTLLAFCCAVLSTAALAQARPGDYPNRAVRVIVPFPAGGATDVLARLISSFGERRWGQPVIVENRPGASSQIGTDYVVKSAPDGYTVLLCSLNLAYEHLVNPSWPFHPIRDFSHLGLMAGSGYALITSAALPVRNFGEFVAYAKANPGKLNQATMTATSASTEELMFRSGLTDLLVKVPYKGGPLAVQAVMVNDAHYWTSAPQDVIELAKQGKVRILAYTEKQRHPLLPDVPTVAESRVGADDYEARFWFALLGPAGMSAPLVGHLNNEMKEFVRQPDVVQRLESLGLKTYASSPDDVRAVFAATAKQVQDVIARGIKMR
jgi:tripartite-type tricarboxylate transporter receptor subunit TctC